MRTAFDVQVGDVTQVPSDLLVLKYAQTFYGADGAVAHELANRGICALDDLQPLPGLARIIESGGVVAPARVMFMGAPPLGQFRYREMREFAERAMREIVALRPAVRSVTTTVHGAGYGLDVSEALIALVTGFREEAERSRTGPARVTFVERDPRRAGTLETALRELSGRSEPAGAPGAVAADTAVPAIRRPAERKTVFVAMPFSVEFEDVYEFGIYGAVRRCGFACERVDETAVTGSIMDLIREGIEQAEFVIADLTEARPNVYLEVGLAWGLNKRVILVAREGDKLHFDLSHHKCIFYKTISKLTKELEDSIRRIAGGGRASGSRGDDGDD